MSEKPYSIGDKVFFITIHGFREAIVSDVFENDKGFAYEITHDDSSEAIESKDLYKVYERKSE